MMLLFSAIFGREVPFTANIGVVDFDKTDTTNNIIKALNDTEIFNVKAIEEKEQAMNSLKAGEVNAVITFPQGFQSNTTTGNATYVTLDIDETDPNIAQIVSLGLEAFFSEFGKKMISFLPPISIIKEESVKREAMGYKEYILAGFLSFPFLFSSMSGACEIIVNERLTGTLKRIRASPARPLSMLWGKTLAVLLQTAISIIIMASLGYLLLNPNVNWNIPLLVPILFLGAVNGIAIGLLISSIARTPREAAGAATALSIILQFFTGAYFSVEFLPSYLQTIARIIPMTYASNAMREIMLKDAGFTEIFPTMAILLTSAIVLYSLGVILYRRWVEKE